MLIIIFSTSFSTCIRRRLSFAKNRWVTYSASLPIFSPLITLSFVAFLSNTEKILVHMTKRKGDRGSSWRNPLEGKKIWVGEPFSRTLKDIDSTHFKVRFTNLLGKFIFVIIHLRYL